MNSLQPVLLIEDDSVDVMTVKRCFKELKITNKLIVAADAQIAFELLLDENNRLCPCIILLDINMPVMNGIEFLEKYHNDIKVKKASIVMLTSSKEQVDINRCFELGIAGYMVKPLEYDKFVQLIEILNKYWTMSELPL